MHDLLAMTSGLVYPEEQTMGGRAVTKVFEEACARLESDHPVSTQEMAEKIAACPLVFAPGTSWQYGTSADIMGAAIEKIVGEPLSVFIEKGNLRTIGDGRYRIFCAGRKEKTSGCNLRIGFAKGKENDGAV